MPSMKEVLSGKITSKDAFDKLITSVHHDNAGRIGAAEVRSEDRRTITTPAKAYGRHYGFTDSDGYTLSEKYPILRPLTVRALDGDSTNALHQTRWWLLREFMRLDVGLYFHSAAMGALVDHFPEYMPHIKTVDQGDDPLAVWYTPDPQAGERDAQVRTSLGRLLRKLYPQVDDSAIRDVEARHRAEILNEIELIPADQIAQSYQEAAATSCMTYAVGHWAISATADNRNALIHPTEVYNAPGFFLAVSRDGSGKVNGRTLVWVNPADPDDKRFVRVYGDSALKTRLERKGFKPGGLGGTRIRRIPAFFKKGDRLGENCYLMPYLDNPAGGSGNPHAGTWVVLDRDPQYLHVVERTGALAARLSRAGVSTADGQITSGYAVIRPEWDVDAGRIICAVTGVELGDNESPRYLWLNGAPVKISPAAAEAKLAEGWIAGVEVWHEKPNGVVDAVGGCIVPPETPLFTHRGTRLTDNALAREAFGYTRLDPRWYPESPWFVQDSTLRAVGGFGDESPTWIKATDAVTVILWDEESERATVRSCHKSAVEGDEKKYVKVHRLDVDRPLYADASDTRFKIERTVSGRKVVRGIHPLTELYNGTLEFPRNVVTDRYMGVSIRRSRKAGRLSQEDIEKYVVPTVKDNRLSVLRYFRAQGELRRDRYLNTTSYNMALRSTLERLYNSNGHMLWELNVDGTVTPTVTPRLPFGETSDMGARAALTRVARLCEAWKSENKPDIVTQPNACYLTPGQMDEFVRDNSYFMPDMMALIAEIDASIAQVEAERAVPTPADEAAALTATGAEAPLNYRVSGTGSTLRDTVVFTYS